MKRVIFWEPKMTDKKKADGVNAPVERVGKFRTKVAPGTPGAVHHTGTLANGRSYDYWGLDVDSVAGKLRWIDKQDGGDFGTFLVLFLESDKYLHQIRIKYDPYNLKDVMNHLCGLGKDVANHVINLSYWVRKAKNADGSFKVKDDGDIVWNKSISFRDVSPQFTFEEWKEFAADNGLEWSQVKRANGKKEWNSDAEYKYWDSRLLGVMRFLLNNGTAFPFMYNSMIGCESPNPSGGGNLTPDEIAKCNEIYERIRPEYQFPFNRNEVTADDAFDMPAEPEPTPAYVPEKAVPIPSPLMEPKTIPFHSGPDPLFPEYQMAAEPEAQPAGDDLPF